MTWTEGVDATQFAEDEETLAKPEPEKPDQPVEFEATKVREEFKADVVDNLENRGSFSN